MIKVEELKVNGFEAALRGMRNPLNSWGKSDSEFGFLNNGEIGNERLEKVAEEWIKFFTNDYSESCSNEFIQEVEDNVYNGLLEQGIYDWDETNDLSCFAFIGPKDMKLAEQLIKAGPEHCKFLRQVNVSMDITAPFYWWKEFDTYKIGTTANSCSTMHTIHKKEFEFKDFATDHMYTTCGETYEATDWLTDTIDILNHYRKLYLETKNKTYWYSIIQMLPTSYLQKRTVTMNYAVLRNIIKQRNNHKLEEWHTFIDSLKELPYATELLFFDLEKEG